MPAPLRSVQLHASGVCRGGRSSSEGMIVNDSTTVYYVPIATGRKVLWLCTVDTRGCTGMCMFYGVMNCFLPLILAIRTHCNAAHSDIIQATFMPFPASTLVLVQLISYSLLLLSLHRLPPCTPSLHGWLILI